MLEYKRVGGGGGVSWTPTQCWGGRVQGHFRLWKSKLWNIVIVILTLGGEGGERKMRERTAVDWE